MPSCDYKYPTSSCTLPAISTPRYYIDFGKVIRPTYTCERHKNKMYQKTFATEEEATQHLVTLTLSKV